MKFYILCDIEGVASLACWDEARSANACYAPMAREMALEAAAAARGLFSGGADEVVIEDMHGDGCNIDCALLPRDARLLRGITHDIVGLTGIFDESYDGVLMVGFHDAASAPGNPTSHTMVSSRIFRLTVNGALWGEFEMYAHAAAYRGVPTLFASGDEGMCAAAARTVPGLLTVPNQIRPRLRRSDKDPGACPRRDRRHDGQGCGGGKNSHTSGASRSLPRGDHLCTSL